MGAAHRCFNAAAAVSLPHDVRTAASRHSSCRQAGQWLTIDVELSCQGITPVQQGKAVQLQVTLFVMDALRLVASHTGQPGTPTAVGAAAPERGVSSVAAMLVGHSFAARSSAAGGTPTAADAVASPTTSASGGDAASSAAMTTQLVDPGVFLQGCYNGLQMAATPGSTQTCRLQALLMQPGLYVLGAAAVQQVVGVQCGAALAADEKAAGGERVVFSQDRLYVLVSRC